MGSSCGRESADIFYWLRYYKKVPLRIFKNPYFWHDTFGVRIKRIIGCSHKNKKVLADDGKPELYCFDCDRYLLKEPE